MPLPYVLSLCFMVFDMITGLIMAVKNKDVDSTKFRDGLWKKTGTGCLLAFGYVVDYAIQYLDIGINSPIGLMLCVSVVVLEAISILENIGNINPDLVSVITPFLSKLNGGENNANPK